MPELPDLEVAKNILTRRVIGQSIKEAELLSPVLLRRPTADIFKETLQNSTIQEITRYGKFLIFQFSPPTRIYLNLMLAGRITLQPSSDAKRKKLGFRFTFMNNFDLRYHDVKSMGKLYLLFPDESTSLIPTFDSQGPDALDPTLTFELFRHRIQKFQAFIKHVLVNQRFIAGLGNAYADEVLFVARIAPFRKRKTLTEEEVEALYHSMKTVLQNAITEITTRTGDSLGFEIRDFLQVHGKSGLPCPSCEKPISSVKSGLRVANFCRHCQK